MAHEADFRGQESESPVAEPGIKWPQLDRRWLYGLAGLGVVGVIVLLFRPTPTRVDGVTVTSGDLQVMVEAEGQTRVRDRYIVAAPVDGRLIRIALTEGDPVNATEVVARIDPLPLTSQVTQAQARRVALQAEIAGVDTQRPKDDALAEAEAQITAAQATQQQAEAEVARTLAHWQQAQRDWQRANDLANEGAISTQSQESAALAVTASEQEHRAAQQQLERAIAAVTAAQADRDVLRQEQSDPDYLLDVYQAEIDSIDAELARLADDARRTTINAPAAGQVLRILEESARFVTAGTPLLEIGNPEDLEIVIDVLSQDAVKIAVGDRIQVTQWGGDDTLLAEVQRIEPAAFTRCRPWGWRSSG
jgi:HlyD family secretion protein